MLAKYHISITRKALSAHFSPCALDAILAANLGQDGLLTGQIGHDEYHFDNNAFEESYAFIEGQRQLTRASLRDEDIPTAWAAFGRLTHTAQDFYAHSNYVALWLSQHDGSSPPPPSEIAPLMDDLLHSPELHSGKLYYPLEVFFFIPVLKHLVMPLLPRDSHAWMNLDSPKCGMRFAYALEAATKRTKHEFDQTVAGLSFGKVALFTDLPS
jgi:hypothetical protein